MLLVFLPPPWLRESDPTALPKQRDCTLEEALELNKRGLGVFYYPNGVKDLSNVPINPKTGRTRFLKAQDIDDYRVVFLDLDMKHGAYPSVNAFLDKLAEFPVSAAKVVLSGGGGCHVYWNVQDLDAMSLLRLNRRLARHFRTDTAVAAIKQAMRVPGTLHTKDKDNFVPCEAIYEDPAQTCTAEQLDRALPPITAEDEAFCQRHYDSVYNPQASKHAVGTELPRAFLDLCLVNKDVKRLFFDDHKNRSDADWALGMALHEHGITASDAVTVLSRCQKAMERQEHHRISYGENIVNKIWETEEEKAAKKTRPYKYPFRTVKEILSSPEGEGKRIRCHEAIDATEYGFRLGHVMGLIGGSGNGKTTFALNLMRWFVERNINEDYVHVYFTLEQTEREISAKWAKMAHSLSVSRPDIDWQSKVVVVGNYNDDGTFRQFTLEDMKEYVLALEQSTGVKVGVVVGDHIGIIKHKQAEGEYGGLIATCQALKAFAIATQTFFIIQSQTSRGKNGGGDQELDLDAAFGTSAFENFTEWLVTAWQPLRRVYSRMEGKERLYVTAYKFAKIRHRDAIKDAIKLDDVHGLKLDIETGLFSELTSDEIDRYAWWNKLATSARNEDRKKTPSSLQPTTWTATAGRIEQKKKPDAAGDQNEQR